MSFFFNGMTLSTLSINSHDFAFSFPKWSHTDGDVFITYKPMIIPLISQCGIFSEQFCPQTKYIIEPPLTMNPSNNLLLIETRLLLWNPRTKYTLWPTLESLLTTPFRLTTSLFDIEDSININKLREWVWYDVRNHEHHTDMILFNFAFDFPKRPHANGMYSLFINSWYPFN